MDINDDVDRPTRQALLASVHRHTGITMTEKKWPLLQGRLRRRLQALSLDSYRDYLDVLDSRADEATYFIDLVTTNETSFFRTPRIWDYLWQQFLPRWHNEHAGSILQIWSAAASSGEEAYSLAMLCEEYRERHPAFRYRILATDIAKYVVGAGEIGLYQGRSIDGLRRSRPAFFEKYFAKIDDRFAVVPALRANVSFREHNLYRRLADPLRIDLVLLRNVLIYFDDAGQQAVVDNVASSLVPDGVLIIGESESLSRHRTGFDFEQPLIYRKQEAMRERRA
ncbi:CheR family methyltransferase [Dyella mobilis]|uniref:CheR family methyltransferase n=1 Tax=Dyella mobilis TaxID=1849582 RepID=UPI00235D68C2|nr:chemotaxis protein methyltransferase [Dyella mobilis]